MNFPGNVFYKLHLFFRVQASLVKRSLTWDFTANSVAERSLLDAPHARRAAARILAREKKAAEAGELASRALAERVSPPTHSRSPGSRNPPAS
jgi:hypothetical protein